MPNSSFFNDMKEITDLLCPVLNKKYVPVIFLYHGSYYKNNFNDIPCVEIICNDEQEKTISFDEPWMFFNRDLVKKAQKLIEKDSDLEIISYLKKIEEILHQVEDNDYLCEKALEDELDASGLFSLEQPASLDLQNDGSEENKNKYINTVWDDLMNMILKSKNNMQILLDVISRAIIYKIMLKDKKENAIILLSEVVKNNYNIFQVLGFIADKNTIDHEQLPIKNKFIENDNSFVQGAIYVLFQKWSDIFKYSLFYSDSEYIMDTDAVIRLTARDLTEGQGLPSYKLIEAISGAFYENAECHGTMALFNNIEKIKYIPFDKPINIDFENIRYIRKLLEMSSESSNNSFVLCVDTSIQLCPRVVGLIKKNHCNNEYMFEFRGFLKWTLKKGCAEVVSFDSGQYSYNKNRLDNYNEHLKKLLKCTDAQIDKIHFVVDTIWKQRHGTMLVLFSDSNQANDEAKRLVKMGRGIGLKIEHKKNNWRDEQLILSLTSIDGALFMDVNSTIYGFGIIVDGEAVVKGTAERGARYNSAKNYIENSAKKGIVNVALVVSEDRTVDLLSATDNM